MPVWIRGYDGYLGENGFLRMDGRGVASFSAGGGGTVNCQAPGSEGAWEQFEIVEHADGTVNIASVAFPSVFLRMDGRGVTSFSEGGGGTVNCQYTAGPWETFTLTTVDPGGTGGIFVNIESVAFPNVFLRMLFDGNGGPNGSGTVNCQYTAYGLSARFFLQPVGPVDMGIVPDVINLSPSSAQAAIESTGFEYSQADNQIVGNFTPYVEAQNPGGWTSALLGSTVEVTIAVPVPPAKSIAVDLSRPETSGIERTIQLTITDATTSDPISGATAKVFANPGPVKATGTTDQSGKVTLTYPGCFKVVAVKNIIRKIEVSCRLEVSMPGYPDVNTGTPIP
jgi:hypothetical protein